MEDSKSFWNWSGLFIGYRLMDGLFSQYGRQLGFFAEGDEVYSCNGAYLGEVRSADRLITNAKKKSWSRSSIEPVMQRRSPGRPDVSPKAMLTDFEDFPPPPAT